MRAAAAGTQGNAVPRRVMLLAETFGPGAMFAGAVAKAPRSAANSTCELGGDLKVNRLRFGAMRLTGDGIWGLAE